MVLKCSSRQCLRRRRFLLLGGLLILLGVGFFVQLRSSASHVSNRQIRTITDKSICSIPNESLPLNCTGDPAEKYCHNVIHQCNSYLSIYNNLFMRTRAVLLEKKYLKGKRLGGEDIHEVLNQAESDEYFHFEKGFVQLPCHLSTSNPSFGGGHLDNIFSSISTYQTCPKDVVLVNETTIAINRQDYANIYHTMTELYTVYLLCRFFQHDPKSVRILFLDAHPKGNLDIFWSTLFHSYSRLGRLNDSTILFRELIWSPPQPTSEIDVQRRRRTPPSFFEDFHHHVLDQFHVDRFVNRTSSCQSLNIFLLLRKNYVAHPRNPSGRVSRQLANEQEVINYLKSKWEKYPVIRFTIGHFENLTLAAQLDLVHRTDILVGVHGAGLTYVLFMEKNRTLVELAPSAWVSHTHFESMSAINGVHYHRCRINDASSSNPEKILSCIDREIHRMCPNIAEVSPTSPSMTTTVSYTTSSAMIDPQNSMTHVH